MAKKRHLLHIFALISKYEGLLHAYGWPNWVLSNHDRSRIATRVGIEQARIAAILLLSLRGTSTIYYGDELGMSDVVIPLGKTHDPKQLNQPAQSMPGREPMRTPMQWDESLNAGFTTGTPWLPAAHILQLRRQEPALHIGKYIPVGITRKIFAFIRQQNTDRFLIVVNLSHKSGIFTPTYAQLKGQVILATHPEREGTTISIDPQIELLGDEGFIVQLNN